VVIHHLALAELVAGQRIPWKEIVEPAEDLPHHPDQRTRLLPGRNAREAITCFSEGFNEGLQVSPAGRSAPLYGAAECVQPFQVNAVASARRQIVGAGPVEGLLKKVRACIVPRRTDKGFYVGYPPPR
jgi:hypothetical protein